MFLHTKPPVHDCGYELVDHPPYSPDLAPSYYFLFPNMKKNTWLGSSIGPRSYLKLRTFSRIRMRASIPWRESKHCNIDGSSVWTTGKNKTHLVKFDHCIIVSLQTIQPTYKLFSPPSYKREKENKIGFRSSGTLALIFFFFCLTRSKWGCNWYTSASNTQRNTVCITK